MDVNQVILLNKLDVWLVDYSPADFPFICRVCIKRLKENDSKSIYVEECSMRIKTLIECYTEIQILENDTILPQRICTECIAFLIEAHTFRSRCRLNDDILRKIHHRTLDSNNDITLIVEQHNYATANKSSDQNNELETSQKIINEINDKRLSIFRCKHCSMIFNESYALRKHCIEAKHSLNRASKCPHCFKMFNSSALALHMRTHTKEKPFVCDICFVAFSLKNNLHRHKRSHEQHVHICELCGKALSDERGLNEHLRLHELNAIDEIGRRVMINNVSRPFACPNCAKCFVSRKQLQVHMKLHNRSFLCNDCGKVFTTKANLVTHTRVHTGEKPFTCKQCSKSFSQSSTLRTHMMTHAEAKPFKCDFCQREFAVRGNFQVHLRLHTDKRPFQCQHCKRGYTTSTVLKKHLRMHVRNKHITEDDVKNFTRNVGLTRRENVVTEDDNENERVELDNLGDTNANVGNDTYDAMLPSLGEYDEKVIFEHMHTEEEVVTEGYQSFGVDDVIGEAVELV